MKRKDFEKSLVFERHEEKGVGGFVVSYSAKCPWFDDCGHSDESAANYGDEEGAKQVTLGKILAHAKRDHGVSFEDDSENKTA